MKQLLNLLFDNYTLTEQEAYEVMIHISESKFSDIELSSFLTTFNMRNITLAEITGFRKALLDLCSRVDLPSTGIDLVGTGGDGKDTFNISTLASFVIAAAGEKVIKQGNYGASSVSGSSNMLAYFGYEFTQNSDQLQAEYESVGITFLHAPLFHPALKNVATLRKNLGVKTFFNIMGPLVNPVQPTHQCLGTFDVKTARLYHYVMQQTDTQYSISTALDGHDEVSLTSPAKIYSNLGEYLLHAKDFGLDNLHPTEIKGGKTIEENAKIFLAILENKGTRAQKQVVLANAALGLKTLHPNRSLEECVQRANESLESKRALQTFRQLLQTA